MIPQILHTLKLWLARRAVARGMSGFEAAHRRITAGAQAIEQIVEHTKERLVEARIEFQDIVDRAKVELDQKELTHGAEIVALTAEQAKHARIADRFKQFIEA